MICISILTIEKFDNFRALLQFYRYHTVGVFEMNSQCIIQALKNDSTLNFEVILILQCPLGKVASTPAEDAASKLISEKTYSFVINK